MSDLATSPPDPEMAAAVEPTTADSATDKESGNANRVSVADAEVKPRRFAIGDEAEDRARKAGVRDALIETAHVMGWSCVAFSGTQVFAYLNTFNDAPAFMAAAGDARAELLREIAAAWERAMQAHARAS